jgi:hypothetical protein
LHSPNVEGATAGKPAGDIAGDFKLISKYLLDASPPDELINRYVAAHEILLGDPVAAEWDFVRRHPATLPYLDAAMGVFARSSLMRKKIILAAAILEASPAYADFFLEEVRGTGRVLGDLVWHGTLSLGKLLVGMPILLIARWANGR